MPTSTPGAASFAAALRWTLQDPDLPEALRDPSGWPDKMRAEWADDAGAAAAARHRSALVEGCCRVRATIDEFQPDALLIVGDDQYETGALDAFRAVYAPTWGRFDRIVRPVPGNHEYANDNGTGYYAYFGARAGSPSRGYYSYDLGAWHLIGLNSNCSVVSCAAGSAQVRWLRADLAVDLPYPRHRDHPELLRLRREALGLLGLGGDW